MALRNQDNSYGGNRGASHNAANRGSDQVLSYVFVFPLYFFLNSPPPPTLNLTSVLLLVHRHTLPSVYCRVSSVCLFTVVYRLSVCLLSCIVCLSVYCRVSSVCLFTVVYRLSVCLLPCIRSTAL